MTQSLCARISFPHNLKHTTSKTNVQHCMDVTERQIASHGPGHCSILNQGLVWALRWVSGLWNTKNERTGKKETSIHPAIHHNRRYGEANFHKAAKLIEADQICFTSLHSFKMAISLPISRAFTVPHSPGSGWELARLSWMKHSNSPVLPWNQLISL